MTRVVRVLPWVLFALVLVLWAPGYIYDPLSDEVTGVSDRVWALSFLAFPLVGLFLALRIPSNALGWLFIIGPGIAGAGISAMEYGQARDLEGVVALSDLLFPLGLLILFASILLFPDGRYPNRWFLGLHVTFLSALVIVGPFLSDELSGFLLFPNFVLPVAGLAYRAITGDATTRRQIGGPVLVVLVGLLGLATAEWFLPAHENPVGDWGSVLLFMVLSVGIPIAIGISITKYRLYEIDRIVSRTVSYAIVVGLLVAVFFAVVTVVTSLLPAQGDLVQSGEKAGPELGRSPLQPLAVRHTAGYGRFCRIAT